MFEESQRNNSQMFQVLQSQMELHFEQMYRQPWPFQTSNVQLGGSSGSGARGSGAEVGGGGVPGQLSNRPFQSLNMQAGDTFVPRDGGSGVGARGSGNVDGIPQSVPSQIGQVCSNNASGTVNCATSDLDDEFEELR